jgi:hypothetical protein
MNLLEGFGEDAVDFLLRGVVGCNLSVGEDGLELGDEVGGGDDVFAELAEALDGAGIDHGDVHDGVARGVLHGDAGVAGEHGFELGVELLPGGVFGLCTRQRIQATSLDAVDEFLRIAVGGDEVEPAAGNVHAGVEAKDRVGEGVAVVVVVEEPGVEVGVTQGGLDGGEIHGGDCIARGGNGGLARDVRAPSPLLAKYCIRVT